MEKVSQKIAEVQRAAKFLVIYRNLLKDPIVSKFVEILDYGITKEIDLMLIEKYFDFYSELVKANQDLEDKAAGNIWQNYILDLIVEDENIFSLECEKNGAESISPFLVTLLKEDLKKLQKLYSFDFNEFTSHLQEKAKMIVDLPCMFTYKNSDPFPHPQTYFEQKHKIKVSIANSYSWSDKVDELALFYKNNGCGKFARYWAFKWEENKDGGKLTGIPSPDPIRLSDLIGYSQQKQEVLRNTSQFVRGYKANNMLLYGDRGTGKSSTIKALVHEFGHQGLRIVEVTKEQLTSLPKIIAELRQRPYRFILYVDDLSFEEYETEYKYLKAVLEGSLEAVPDNLLIYATSNRRHLIREYHRDRDENDEKKSRDTQEEKMSLSDRFGITVIYLAPDQEKYLRIVEGIAKSKGIKVEPEKLRKMALEWELWHNSRSGRTARQFIDDLIGKLAREKGCQNQHK